MINNPHCYKGSAERERSLVRVRIAEVFGPYQVGDICGFPVSQAITLIEEGKASPVGDWYTPPAPKKDEEPKDPEGRSKPRKKRSKGSKSATSKPPALSAEESTLTE